MLTVLPAPDKTFRPDLLKNSTAGEKKSAAKNLLMDAYFLYRGILEILPFAKCLSRQRVPVRNLWTKHVFSADINAFKWKKIFNKVRPLFRPFFANRKKVQPPIFPAAQVFIRIFLVMRSKFRLVGNTGC
jgi:hypothetical protein